MKINGALFVTFLMLLTALALSGVAAWFSVVGLIAIFAASPFAVAVMAGTLEVAKLVCASWVYNNWHRLPGLIKGYLTVAVVILMFITSMGIFGYLSKAHLDQGVPTGEVSAKVALYDEKIATERANIDTARTALKQMDAQVDQLLNRTDDDKGANRAVAVRKQQAAERKSLQKDIEVAQTAIAKLNEERAPVAAELRKVEAEVGPIKYIAALIYGDNPDVNTLERAVRWVTILLVSVFDPLAVIMLIAANFGMRNFRDDEEKDPIEQLEEKLEVVKAEQATINRISEERAPIAAEVRKVEAEVGPIKYIAALIYGDNLDTNVLERAVRWVIILLVCVFDPLAIMLLLAASESLKWAREKARDDEEKQDQAVVIIKQGMVDHTLIADPEINMSATLVKLAKLSK